MKTRAEKRHARRRAGRNVVSVIASVALALALVPVGAFASASDDAADVTEGDTAVEQVVEEAAPVAEETAVEETAVEPAEEAAETEEVAEEPAAEEAEEAEEEAVEETEAEEAEPAAEEAEETAEPVEEAEETEPAEEAEKAEEMPAQELYAYVGNLIVKVTAPEGVLPADSSVNAYKVTDPRVINAVTNTVESADGVVALNVEALDITIQDKDGKTIQPKDTLNVTIFDANMNEGDTVSVYHVNDAATRVEQVSTLQADPNVQSFETDHFSIYAIVDSGDTHDGQARRTYEFLNVDDTPYEFQNTAGNTVTNQILKEGEELQEVGIPDTGTDELNFNGWYYWNPDTETWGAQVQFNTPITGIDETETVYIKANAAENRYVTFYENPQGGTILTRDQAPLGTTYDISTQSLPSPQAGLVFVGWSTEKSTAPEGTFEDDRDVVTETTVTVNGDLEYYPVFKSAHWLTFVSAKVGQGASYIPSQFVLVGENTKKPSDPTYTGYTFVNWSTTPHEYDSDGNITNMAAGLANPFTFGSTISEDTMLYAYYNDAQTNYTIVYWKQNVTDAKNAADSAKTYSYFTLESATGTAHQTANIPTSATTKTTTDPGNFTGFTYNASKSDTSITVEPDGSSIMNVYYDRALVTMQFYASAYNQAPQGGYGSNVWNGNQNVTTYTGLYGQTLAQNGYSWPEGVWTYYSENNQTRGMSYLGQFVLPDDVRDTNNLLFRAYRSSNNPNQTIRMYLEQPDGSYVLDASGYANNATTFYFSEKYDGYTVTQYRRHSNYGGWGNWANAGTSVSINGYDILEVRYNLKSYTLHFLDPVDNSKVLPDVTVKYNSSLASYAPTAEPTSTHPGKEFDGKWYADAACSTEFDFANSTMPNADVNVYAGWEDIWYLITVDPNGGEITTQTGGATWFWETYGETVEEYGWVQRDYVEDSSGTYYYTNNQYAGDDSADRHAFYSTSGSGQAYKFEDDAYKLVGWYDKDTGQPYQFSAPITKNVNLIAQWRRVGEYHLIYDAVDGTNAPVDGNGYADRSATSVLGNPTPPAGYVFDGWEYNGKTYHTGDAITVDASLADADKNITITAKYSPVEDQKVEVTHITWNGNNKDTLGREIPGVTSATQWTKSSDDVPYNEGVDIESAPDLEAYADYTFLGWAKVAETADAPYAESDLFLEYSDGAFTVDGQSTSQVGADEKKPYETLYAIWAPKTYKVTVTKTVVGGSEETPFNFDATFSNAGSSLDGTKTFTLVGAESATVDGTTYTNTKEYEVPANAKLTVAEHEEAAYTTKVTVGETETEGVSTGELTITEDTTIAYTNTLKSIDVNTAETEIFKKTVEAEGTAWAGDSGKEFSFQIAAVDGAPLPVKATGEGESAIETENTTATATFTEAGSQTLDFGTITFEAPGEYKYTLTETDPGDGWTADAEEATAIVTIAFDQESGTLAVDNIEVATITNTYAPDELIVDPTDAETTFGTKSVTATTQDGKGKDFGFTLAAASEGAPMPTSADATVSYEAEATGEQTIPFGKITYKEPGTYTYTITEADAGDGWTTEGSGETVTVVVTDNGDGTMSAEVTGITITNEYKLDELVVDPTETGAEFGIKDVTATTQDGEGKDFSFTLAATTDGAPMPESETATTSYAADETGEQTIPFGKITYKEPGTYTYTITEADAGDGWTTEGSGETVTVVVTDNGDGTMSAEVTGITITNEYKLEELVVDPTDTETTFGTKTVAKAEGSIDFDATDFDFTLAAASDGAPMPEAGGEEATTSYDAAETGDKVIPFGKITYKEPGEYTYTITEADAPKGWTTEGNGGTVTVTVTDNGDGTMSAEVTDVTVTNTYNVKPVEVDTDAADTTFGTKTVAGEDFEAKTFEFTLAAVDGAPVDQTAGSVEATEAGNYKIDLGTITYEKAGTYEYTLTETTESGYGWTCDNDAKTITVTVSLNDAGDALEATVEGVTIVNAYKTKTVVVDTDDEDAPFLTKTVEGEDFDPKTFDFEIEAAEGSPEATKSTDSVEFTEAGSKLIDFGTVTFTKVGEFQYKVSETTESGYGWTCDNEGKTVTVNVTVNKEGQLEAEVTGAEITNTYEATPVDVDTDATGAEFLTKVVEGEGFDAKTFEFTLEGDPIDQTEGSVEATAAGTYPVDFGTITYTKVGKFEYTATEITTSGDGWQCGTVSGKITVNVTIDADGKLQAKVTGASVTNKYAHITITKTTTSEPANGETYALGEKIEYKVTVTNDGAATVSDITVTDELTGDEWKIDSLEAGASKDFTASYTVTEADILEGTVKNVATGTTTDPSDPEIVPGEKEDTPDPKNSSMKVEKTTTSTPANGETYALGETITYKVTVENDGNMTLSNVVVTDELVGKEWTVDSLKPGDTKEFTASYTVTEDDIKAGKVCNEATATATDPEEEEVVPDPGTTEDPTDPIVTDPLKLTKTADKIQYYNTGEIVKWHVQAENAGNVTLYEVVITDELTGDTFEVGTLAPGAKSDLYDCAEYTVTESDFLAGSKTNVAESVGYYSTTPGEIVVTEEEMKPQSVVGDEDVVEVTATAKSTVKMADVNSHLTVTKKDTGKGTYKVGDKVTWKVKVTNDGNVTLYDVTVSDELTGDEWVISKLAVGKSKTFTATYKVTKKDAEKGSVKNIATATGNDGNGDPADSTPGEDTIKVQKEVKPDTPDTGDNTNLFGTGVVAVLALAGAAAALRLRRRDDAA